MTNPFVEKIEVIPGRLFFCTVQHKDPAVTDDGQCSYAIKNPSSQYIYFTTDASLTYTAFFADFGPLNLGLTFKFCEQLDTYLTQSKVEKRPVIYYCSQHPHYRSNSAVLLCAYLIFVMKMNVEQAYAPFIGISPRLAPSRDAAFCINTYPIFPLDCVKAFYRASQLNHFNYATFDVHKHDQLAKLEHGDVSWIIPGKFIAFSGPVAQRREVGQGVYALSPEAYVPLFHSLGVSCVVRFNKKCYDRNIFVRGGIRHVDLYYEDGGNPSEEILHNFLKVCEQETGAIAVHCKAGLGRTGTNIAAYMMKHYGYTAREAIAWCRVCRPGSVVGPQQQYLESKQSQMWAEGRRFRQEGGSASLRKQRSHLSRNGNHSMPDDGTKKRSSFRKNGATVVEETMTQRLLSRIRDEVEGSSFSVAQEIMRNESASSEPDDRRSHAHKGKNMSNGLITSDFDRRPSTTENSSRKSKDNGNMLKIKSRSMERERKESRGTASISTLGSGATSSSRNQAGRSPDVPQRSAPSDRRPKTSAGTVRSKIVQNTAASSGSSKLRSGGGLRNMHLQAQGISSGHSGSSSRPASGSSRGTSSVRGLARVGRTGTSKL